MVTTERHAEIKDRLIGQVMPKVHLSATDGATVDVSRIDGTNIVYCYPRTSPPDGAALPGWDVIPGAKGCTAQSCGYRDLYGDLREAGADRVIGLSTQNTAYQQEMRDRLDLPFHLLSDADLKLTHALELPTFAAGGMTLLSRLTFVFRGGKITNVAYPVENASGNADDLLAMLNGSAQ